MQNISFNDFGYVIKPLQPSSAIYGAPPFTGNWIGNKLAYATPILYFLYYVKP